MTTRNAFWRALWITSLVWTSGLLTASASDWPRFRGPNGNGISADEKTPPVEFSASKNLKWKRELPGPGLSCPIVVGDRVYLTCWSGFATGNNQGGGFEDLKRHLICINRKSGEIVWDKAVKAELPEDSYNGMFRENGYASHTPVCDGEHIYAFFGKSGIIAFDLKGEELWRKNVGKGSDGRGWGTASSPILYKNLVIVTASIEDRAMVAFDKLTGQQVWKAPADGFESTWGTPVLVDLPDGRTDLVIAVPGEIWGLDPEKGKIRWYCQALGTNSMCSSVAARDGIVYVVEAGGGPGGGAAAVKAGGKGDVTKTHVVWSNNEQGRIGTPVVLNDRMYWVNNRVVRCVDATNGKRVYQGRLKGDSGSEPEPEARPGRPGGFGPGGPGRGGPGGGRGGGGGQDYASPVVSKDKMYCVSRSGEIYVVKLGDTFDLLSTNRVCPVSDEFFNSTPAISDGDLFIRSSTTLYCVGTGS